MDSSPPKILPILSFTFSTTSLSKQPNSTSDILPILPLRHNQPSSTFVGSINNIPSLGSTDNIPSLGSTDNIPASSSTNHLPNAKQHQPQQQNEAFPTHGTILTITGGSNTDFDIKR
jgi:hypothetical protein